MNKLKEAKEARKKLRKEDKAWSITIRNRANNRCEICGRDEVTMNAHHIIPRENREFRHNLMNGICLCPKCHKYSFEISAHKNPLAFFKWLEKNKPKQYKYLKEMVV